MNFSIGYDPIIKSGGTENTSRLQFNEGCSEKFVYTEGEGEEESGWDGMDSAAMEALKSTPDDSKLLIDGKPMVIPDVQRIGVKTEDEIMQIQECLLDLGTGKDASLLRARLQSPQLLSDMQAFKAANPTGTLADFVRWYSPVDWIGSRTEGHLSTRMIGKDNAWSLLWEECKPAPVEKQQPLYNKEGQIQKALHYMETISPSDLLRQLLNVALSCIYRSFATSDRTYLSTPELRCRGLSTLSKPLATLKSLCEMYLIESTMTPRQRGGRSTPASGRRLMESECNRICQALSTLEISAARLTSATAKLGGRMEKTADVLVQTGSAALTSDEEKSTLRRLVRDIDEIFPDVREYDITVRSTTPEFGTGYCHAIATVSLQSRRSDRVTENVQIVYSTTGESMPL